MKLSAPNNRLELTAALREIMGPRNLAGALGRHLLSTTTIDSGMIMGVC